MNKERIPFAIIEVPTPYQDNPEAIPPQPEPLDLPDEEGDK